MIDKVVGTNIGLRQSQIKQIEEYLNNTKKYKSVASFFQHLVDNFFKQDKKTMAKDFMLYLGYPMIFTAVMLYVAATAQKVNETLLKNMILSDMIIYGQVYFVIGFAWLGILIAGFVFLMYKPKRNK